jgi:SAM-dependent methyltransferase
MPFPEKFFDFIVMSEVIEHLDDSTLESTFEEIKRVLRPGGRFIGTVPARENLAESVVVCPECGIKFHRWGHKRSFDIPSLTKILQRRFHVEKVYELFFVEWEAVGWWRRSQGLVKRTLSLLNIGTYGACRNIYFSVRQDS